MICQVGLVPNRLSSGTSIQTMGKGCWWWLAQKNEVSTNDGHLGWPRPQ